MKTMREKFQAALEARGSAVIPSRSRKFVVMTRATPTDGFYFIGKSGSLRIGQTIQGSIPASSKFKQLLLESVQ